MTRYFDKVTQISFRDSSKPYFIRFGRRENDPNMDIKAGTIKLSGQVFLISFVLSVNTIRHLREQVASFFEPSVTGIIDCIKDIRSHSCIPIKVFAVT